MKKFFSILIVAVAVLAVSCGGNANKAADQAESTEVVAITDSTVCDSTCCNDSLNCCGDSTCVAGAACKTPAAQ